MKKIKSLFLLFVMGFFVTSCSFFDNASLSPPNWIIGSWSTNTGDAYTDIKFVFTSDNCVMSSSNISTDFVKDFNKSLSDDSSDTLYTITVTTTNTNAKYSFEKVSDTSFNYTDTLNGVTYGPLKLYKQ